MSDTNKPKNYYSLNLTEGRIFIIFISILLVIALVIFAVAFFMSNKKPKETVNNNTQSAQSQNNELASNLYDNTSNSIISNNPLSNSSSSSSSAKTVLNDNKNLPDNLSNPTANSDLKTGNGNLDNSEVLYSSKFINSPEFVSKDKTGIKKNKIVKKNVRNESVKNDAKISGKSNSSGKKVEKELRYIIQIGSYVNKKIADDVSSYYEKQGYTTFIKEKENNGKTFYRLRIGPFKEKDKAVSQLSNLKNTKYGKDSFISIVYL